MAMLPHERSLVKRLEGKPFVLLGVNADSTSDELKRLQEKHNISWRSWFDGPNGRIAAKYHIEGWPTVYLIDHTGVIRKMYLGRPPKTELDHHIDQLVREAEEEAAQQAAAQARTAPANPS